MYLEAMEASFLVTAHWSSNMYIGRIDLHLLKVTGMPNCSLALFALRRVEIEKLVSMWFGGYWVPDIVDRVVNLVLQGEDWDEELAWLGLSEVERGVLGQREEARERVELTKLRLEREAWAEAQMVSPWDPWNGEVEESWD